MSSPEEAGSASDNSPGEVNTATPPKPVYLLPEILTMIFTEFMPKPAIHFAALGIQKTATGFIITVNPWSKGTMQSGYLAYNTLRQTCSLARKVASNTILEPSLIQYQDGIATVDSKTDIVCFVLPKFHWRQQRYGQLDRTAKDFRDLFGKMRRTAVLVTREMWLSVLTAWFIPKSRYDEDYYYRKVDGRLHGYGPFCVRAILRNGTYEDGEGCFTEDTTLILADVSIDDWHSFYKKWPVVSHDRNGTYVKVHQDLSINPHIINRLWWKDSPWLYRTDSDRTTTPNLNLDEDFESRVNALMTPVQRVAFLLGIANDFGFESDCHEILVRKPDDVGIHTTTSTPAQHKPTEHTVDSHDGPQNLGPDDPEEQWLKLALNRVLVESQRLEAEYNDSEVDPATCQWSCWNSDQELPLPA